MNAARQSAHLADELKARRAKAEARRDPAQVAIMQRATDALAAQGIERSALAVGDSIPRFALPNARGQSLAIDDLLRCGALILTFYRGGWCPYCNLELRAYQRSLAAIEAHGAQVVAVSPQLPDPALSNAQQPSLAFEVLSDVGNRVARQFGLVFAMPRELIEVYRQLGVDVGAHNGDGRWDLPVPATYLVAPDGRIAFAHVDADYTRRAEPQRVIDALATLDSIAAM